MKRKHRILIVDDESANLQKLKRTFVQEYLVFEAAGGDEALALLRREPVAAIITDQRMPGMAGVELLKKSLELCPDAVRIILTGYTEVDDLIDAINKGHVNRYITKPWEPDSLRGIVRDEIERWELRRENERLARELEQVNDLLAKENFKLKKEVEVLRETEKRIVYESRAMEELLKLLDRVVSTDSTVLIHGETGTGKELLAQHVHSRSNRSDEVFVPVNCGAIPADLAESAFFGHRKGSFTGASEDRKGFFELADKGTLFLDEIGEAPINLQVKLLRVLQEGEIAPIGAEKSRKVDVRIIASTNRNLAQMVDEGRFRQDLFFRLNVFSVHVPPLRTRPEDVDALAEYFLERVSFRLNKSIQGFSDEAMGLLRHYHWPGNVRELENEIERVAILCDFGRRISPDLISDRIRFSEGDSKRQAGQSLKGRLASLEKDMILKALRTYNQNKTRAAEALGITRQTIIAKLKQYESVN